MTEEDPGAVAAYDQVLADYQRTYPGHSLEWYHAMMRRHLHYVQNDGDMTGAPELPDEPEAGQ